MHSKGLHVVILKALIKLGFRELVVMWVNYKPIDDTLHLTGKYLF